MAKQTREQRSRWLLWLSISLATGAIVVAIVVRWWRQRQAKLRPPTRRPAPPPIPLTVEGLTEAEAQARRIEGQDNAIPFRPERSLRRVWGENVFTIFNLNLVGLAFAQLLLGLPLDAVLSMGMILLNAILNIGQEMLARIRLRQVEESTRLAPTVIREGKVRSLDPNEIVLGDLLVAGPGDYLLVDGQVAGEGQIVVDESMLSARNRRLVKQAGDMVYAGSFCISGRAAYEAQKVGTERLIVAKLAATEAGKEELTSLERIIDHVLRILLLVVAVMTALLLVKYFNVSTAIETKVFADAASVIFSIAPASLFFMIFLTYAAGTADLAKVGALVHRARAVESLAQATTICFAKAGILTGTHVELESIERAAGQDRLAASRIRQIVGDYVRSTSMDNLVARTIAATFDGNRRAPIEENPFLSAYGWSAITFDDDDLRGVYVLGEPQVLEPHLLPDEEAPPEEKESQSPLTALRKRLPPIGRFFRRSESVPEEEQASTEADDVGHVNLEDTRQSKLSQGQQNLSTTQGNEDAEAVVEPQTDAPKQNLFRRAVAGVRKAIPKRKAVAEEPESEQKDELEETALLFAYQPQIEPLYDDDGLPKLPEGLIPLCTLRYAERVHPEAIETVQGFAETGVHIKIFSPEAPDRAVTILKQAGLDGSDEQSLGVISGPELAGMDVAQLRDAAHAKTVFGHISPEQARLVVEALRAQGQTVAVVGDGTNDVPAMRQANLAIAQHSSSQAALSVADMVLLQDSPKVLLDVLSKGQRIVNGLLDVLKLYLTQMLYLTILIVAIPVFAQGYPYASKQGTIIAIVTVSIPSVALSLWTATGVLPSRDLRWLLVRFVGPAAPTIGTAALAVYLFFLDRTGDMAYAQLTVTYTLMATGLLLVVFIKPPSRLWAGGAPVSHDWRFAAAVPILLAASFLLAWIPLAHDLFLLDRLRQPLDYAIIALIVVVWAVLLRVIWWAMPFVAKSERVGRALAKPEG